MRFGGRLLVFLGVIFLFGTLGFAKSPAKTKSKKKAVVANSTAADPKPGSEPTPAAASRQASRPTAKTASKPAATAEDEPKFTPVAATTGTLGLFTIETGELMPQGGWSFSGYANKFGRMPGSVTLLQYGLNFGYALTDRVNVYVGFIPDEHLHISSSNPGAQLSLDAASTLPLYGNTAFRELGPGQPPGYVQDYPFAAHNGGGVGPLTFGVKFGLVSESSGAPVSLSLRDDIIIPTVQSTVPLLQNGTQLGQFADQIGVALSKHFGHDFEVTGDLDFYFGKGPKIGALPAVELPHRFIAGGGFIVFPEKRIQFMNEYTSVIFQGAHTPDNSFGARDPLDGVWGVRLYPTHEIAVDLGYRYMLNLDNSVDRSGFVIKVAASLWPRKPAPPPPPPVNHPPTAACSADKPSLFAGSNDNIAVTAMASDPDGDPLNYSWSATGGQVDGNGPQVRWLSAGVAPGNYTITAAVNDGRGGMTTCSVQARVDPRPNRPPTVTLTSDQNTVLVGARVHFTANGADPDNDPLTYTWRTNGGNLNASGTSGDLDTAGVAPGAYTVTVRVDDGRGGAADASKAINVQAPPPPPQAITLNGCDFKALNSARVDNVCKRQLDDAAVRLQNAPGSSLVIVGYADPRERGPAKLAGDRGGNAAKYLAGKGLDSSRITTRTGTGQTGAAQQNRRADVIFVPQGATY